MTSKKQDPHGTCMKPGLGQFFPLVHMFKEKMFMHEGILVNKDVPTVIGGLYPIRELCSLGMEPKLKYSLPPLSGQLIGHTY